MTNAEIDKKIAELEGWTYKQYFCLTEPTYGWFPPSGAFDPHYDPPPYCTDPAIGYPVWEKHKHQVYIKLDVPNFTAWYLSVTLREMMMAVAKSYESGERINHELD